MKLNRQTIDKLKKKVARQEELAAGRVSYNRVHKSKKTYSRKGCKSINLFDM